jgi:hypothetical protein
MKALAIVAMSILATLLSAPAKASTYDVYFTANDFPFSDYFHGTIGLEVEGLTNNSTGAASDVILILAPSALGLTVGYPPGFPQTYPPPFDLFTHGEVLANTKWTVTDGVITAVGDFSWSSDCSRCFVAFVSLDSSLPGGGAYIVGSSDGNVACEGSSCLAANAPATPLPAALPLFVSGLGAVGLLGWRRKRKLRAA